MRTFMDEKFLLHNETAEQIYEGIHKLPIIDYHCHLSPAAIARNARFNNMTELWLGTDHYKWRLMRMNGVPESHITGNAPPEEKFAAFCAAIENAMGNPVYHWAHLELRTYFGNKSSILAERSSQMLEWCNRKLESQDFCVHNLLKMSKVDWLATTDDPADTMAYHLQIRDDNVPGLPKVYPSFRPGTVRRPERPDFADYIKRLGDAAEMKISNWDDLLAALSQRMDAFAEAGCKISDHSLEPPVFDEKATDADAAKTFAKALKGETLTPQEMAAYKTRLLAWLGGEYFKRNWVMQLRVGAQRDNSTKMRKIAGEHAGFDIMSDADYSQPLARILDDMENRDVLPRTILYGLNPASDDMLAVLAGCFAGGGIRARVQWGAPWWFNDSKRGIDRYLEILASHGILANFIGVTTDSRSFLSFVRHDYFRRILCNRIGEIVQNGEFPRYLRRLDNFTENICYNNAKNYFA